MLAERYTTFAVGQINPRENVTSFPGNFHLPEKKDAICYNSVTLQTIQIGQHIPKLNENQDPMGSHKN